MNLNTFLLIDGSLMLIGLPLLMILKGKKRLPKSSLNRESHSHYSSDVFLDS